MIRTHRTIHRKGQILIKAPILFVVFVGFCALAIDVGFIHLRKAQVQAGAEAAAFAAAWQVSTNFMSSYGGTFPEVELRAARYAEMNAPGCEAPVFEWGNWTRAASFYVPPDSQLRSAVRVTVSIRQRRFLSAFFGKNDDMLVGRSTVVWPPYGDVWPMTISSTTLFTPNSTMTFGPSTTNNAPGNKGWLSFNGDMSTGPLGTYLDGGPFTTSVPAAWDSTVGLDQTPPADYTLQNGSEGTSISITGSTGLMASLNSNIIDQINSNTVVFIPIWDSVSGQGSNTTYNICGLVPVQLIGPFTSLDNIEVRILPDGAMWFQPNELPQETVRKHFKPELNIVMVD